MVLRVPDVGGALDWSPDGAWFVTEGPENSGIVDVRDARTGASVRSWTGHEDDVNDVLFSPDGTALLTAGDDGALRLWDPETGALRAEHVQAPGDDGVPLVLGSSISADGQLVAAVWMTEDQNVLRVINAVTGAAVVEVGDVGAPFFGFRTAFSPDGREIAVPSWSRDRVVIYDTATGAVRRTLDPGPSTSVRWSPDGRWIAVTQVSDPDAYIFNARSGNLRFTLFGHADEIRSVDWSSDSARLATASGDGTVRIWDLTDGGAAEALVLTSADMSAGVQGVVFSPDDSQVMAGEQRIGRVLAWDVGHMAGGEWAAMPTSPTDWTTVVATQDGQHVLAPGPERAVTMWDPTTGTQVRAYGGDEPAAMVVAGGEMIAAVTNDGILTAWNAESGGELFTIDRDDGLSDIDITADGRFLATGAWAGPVRIVRIFDRSGAQRETLDVSADHDVSAVALSPDASLAAVAEDHAADGSGRVQLWDVARRAIVHTIDARAADVAFSADGTRLAIAQADGATTVWTVSDAGLVVTLTGHLGPVSDVSFGADGSTIATTSSDGTVRLWDSERGAPRLVLPGHDVVSWASAFVQDDSMLVSAGGDGVARVWALDIDDLMAIAREKLTRGLTDAECREYLHVETCP